jgi:ketosteroid isomerase-like protein
MKKLIFVIMAVSIIACNEQAKVEEDQGMTNSERIKGLYDAFAAGDVELVLSNFAEDIRWSEAENFIYDYGAPLVGADAIVEGVFAKLGSEWEYWNLEDKEFFDIGEDRVLVTGRYKAKNKASGKELDAQFAHVWQMRDTLAIIFQQYTDTKQAAETVIIDEVEETQE